MCNTTNVTNSGMWNSFLILFSPSGVILTLKGHGQGHFLKFTLSVITLPNLTIETTVISVIQLINSANYDMLNSILILYHVIIQYINLYCL